jgi:peptidoglycan hydrolase-like protein with peptidoglycan-binding domain
MLPVQLGERGNAVAAVQQRLAANQRWVAVDGEFGPRTRRALIAFQRAHGLTPDGLVGRDTWGRWSPTAASAPEPDVSVDFHAGCSAQPSAVITGRAAGPSMS